MKKVVQKFVQSCFNLYTGSSINNAKQYLYLDFACQNDTLIQVNDHKKTVTVVMCSRYKIYAKP